MKTDPNPRNEPLPVSDWLSIEQAPRDGTWVEGRWDTVDGRRQEEFDEKIRFDSELGRWTTPRTSLEALRHPTHFRPLHPTPEAGATRETEFRITREQRDKFRGVFAEWLTTDGNDFDGLIYCLLRETLRSDLTACRKQLQTATEVVNTLQGICEGYEQRLKVSEPALTASRAEAEGLRRELRAMPRVEECCECHAKVSDWVEAEHTNGRICRPCETVLSLRAQLTTERTLREAAEREKDELSRLNELNFLDAVRNGQEAFQLAEKPTAAQTALASAREDSERLDWLLDFITQNGGDGIAALQWTVVDPEELMEDRQEVVFDRAAIDAALALLGKGEA